jgi:hypothetical protein
MLNLKSIFKKILIIFLGTWAAEIPMRIPYKEILIYVRGKSYSPRFARGENHNQLNMVIILHLAIGMFIHVG